ncbi:GNAT superfamily N-acetyltransferase [Flavobacterium sp. 14A]|nr:GNAT family N-acetyltransferase [Flavobacterium sp. 14A]NRT11962.1 GNAT superfamily N-acetyltransferase [Flavobacterium sp. 14A]
MNLDFKKAVAAQIPEIWIILKQAIARRKADGSQQWQDGYPNPEVILNDINKAAGYILLDGEIIIGYTAILINDEPEYENIQGKWLSDSDFVVFHRVAIAQEYLGKRIAKILMQEIEKFAAVHSIKSIKADTSFDNQAMIAIFEKLHYVYCGEVYFRGSPRRAYEKILKA